MKDKQESNSAFEQTLLFLYDRTNYETFQSIPYDQLEKNLKLLTCFLDWLGSDWRKLNIVHVAGTKGKGSVCMILERILRESGYKTGLFTSPHLYCVTERFAINGFPCKKKLFAETVLELREKWELFKSECRNQVLRGDSETMDEIKRPSNPNLTFFEWSVIIAFTLFVRENVDVVLLETGLGGRYDATNVCVPRVSVITSISYDHQEQLGNTLLKIAGEKAGIIKPEVPVVCGAEISLVLQREHFSGPLKMDPSGDSAFGGDPVPETVVSAGQIRDVQRLIKSVAQENRAPFYQIETVSGFAQKCPLAVWGEHQRWNVEIALTVLEILAAQGVIQVTPSTFLTSRNDKNAEWTKWIDRLTEDEPVENYLKSDNRDSEQDIKPAVSPFTVCCALKNLKLPARIQPICQSPLILVDGAHNRMSVIALIDALKKQFGDYEKTVLFATTTGKDVRGMLVEILPFFDRIIFTAYSGDRALPLAELQKEILKILEQYPQFSGFEQKLYQEADFNRIIRRYRQGDCWSDILNETSAVGCRLSSGNPVVGINGSVPPAVNKRFFSDRAQNEKNKRTVSTDRQLLCATGSFYFASMILPDYH